jgi:outer membrane murein-binding lipoprotein Lpp
MGKVKDFLKNTAKVTGAVIIAAGELAEERSNNPVILRGRVRDLRSKNENLEFEVARLREDLYEAKRELNSSKYNVDRYKYSAESMRSDYKFIYEMLVRHRDDLCKSMNSFVVDEMIRMARRNS